MNLRSVVSGPYNDFLKEIRRCDRLVRKQKSLRGSGKISDRELDFIYEIAFLSAYVSFEVFIERQFEALLAGRPYYRRKCVKRRVDIRSEAVAHEVIKGRNEFPKYLPVQELECVAQIFFVGGVPFSQLEAPHKETLRAGQLTRNVIAHRSKAAQRKFERKVLAGLVLRPSKRTPAGFLRSQVSRQQDRFEQFLCELALIGRVFVQ